MRTSIRLTSAEVDLKLKRMLLRSAQDALKEARVAPGMSETTIRVFEWYVATELTRVHAAQERVMRERSVRPAQRHSLADAMVAI